MDSELRIASLKRLFECVYSGYLKLDDCEIIPPLKVLKN